ncbi:MULTISPECIES: choice-of-anchor I family protein [Microbacterium]|uniref:choice-of-anchor I family protein n=1 Tax=Microbacterium TaxID=33882 RepID=UPI00277E43DA|nr:MULTISPECIES: choice-of-anchor I family protein [Microbacterium]MDQ1085295.1 5'-nucleotidase [Microbacterium sp. SORGH_AS_0344]MDQ1169398.1 5'-nucleotidase [Microbacterium proteolyticum]
MPSSFLRRTVAFTAATAAVCALALSGVTAASAAVVPAPVRDSPADSAVSLRPIGTYETGVFDQSAAEIVHAYKNRLFVVNAQAGAVDVLDNTDPTAPKKLFSIAGTGVANSVAVRADGLGVIALEDVDKTAPGRLVFFDADAAVATVLGEVAVGALPDMVTISDDGTVAVVANEGEPAENFSVDPEGSVGVVSLPVGKSAPAQDAVRTAGFEAFEQGGTKTLDPGVRVFGPDVAAPDQGDTPLAANRVSRNLEPEYVAVAGGTAYVTLQEANSFAVVDIASAEVTAVRPLGIKPYYSGVTLDASDRDPEGAPTYNQSSYYDLWGMYMPDGIQAYEANGETYLVTANEGDGRAWGDYTDTARVGDLGEDGLAPVCADAAVGTHVDDAQLGRLNIATDMGLNADGSCYTSLYTFGGRGFSVWDTEGNRMFDSNADFEAITHDANPEFFNSNHSESNLEGRSDDKGPEPENLAIGQVDGRTYAFIGLERVGGVMTYDITDPRNATYAGYVNNRDFSVSVEDELTGDAAADRTLLSQAGDLGPEGVEFIPVESSPNGRPLVVVGNEVSGTTTVFEVTDPGLKNIDILTINDFHGRLEAGPQGDATAGAAVIAGAVTAKEAANPNTLFVSAGDNIGASTFTSLIQDDSPTIDTLVASGLDVSAVGNHEFDRGFADLTDRVLPEYGGGEYGLGANVYKKGTKEPALDEYAIKDVDGVRVAFIGTVTPDTAVMVDPAGIEDLDFGDQLEAANRVAAELTAGDLADVIVLLTHSGAAVSNDCAALAADQAGFGNLATNASPEIDAIVSAHTHQTYACDIAVAGTDRTRPVIQASEYGKAMGQLSLTFDTRTDSVASITGTTFPLKGAFPADAEIAAKVAGYVAEADVIGAEPVGRISGDILRGGTPPGNDRGVESSMGNWVADVYLWATSENPAFAGAPAQIALMNPGGLRADLLKGDDGVVTYKEAALVQPFANTLVTVTLTGDQIRGILNEQWKATGDRPKLHLGVSEGFTYEYVQDPTTPRVGSVVSMAYQGTPIAATDTFTVVTNSFLANGGDGFATFKAGTNRTDTGQVDLDATLAYFESTSIVDPAPLGRAVLTTVATPGTGSTGGPDAQPGQSGAAGTRPGSGLAVTGTEMPWGIALAGGFLVVAGGLAAALRRRRV